jgi:S1-C subfamily serine protease
LGPHGTAAPSRDRISDPRVGIVALVNNSPEEPDGGDPGAGEGGGSGPSEPDAPLRGWIDPDDRLWRHPSEIGAPAPSGSSVLSAPPAHPYRSAVMILVGVVAVMAAIAAVLVLLSPSSQRPLANSSASQSTPAGASLTTLAGTQNTVPTAAEAAGRSMVALRATTSHGTVTVVGVAVAEGGLVATTADGLRGLQRLMMIGPNGTLEAASLVGTDTGSDVALVDVPEDLPVAPFADDGSLSGGATDWTLSFVPAGGATLALHCTPGAVTAVGSAIGSGPAGGMPVITSSTGSPSPASGEPLLNAAGSVIGLLYQPSGAAAAATFLPSGLVLGVANDLRSDDHVVHGWLGVTGADAPNAGGARISAVQAGSPAAGHLSVGQVIVAVNSVPVRTMAELRARLYVLPPGSSVGLSVQQPSGTSTVDVTLSSSS